MKKEALRVTTTIPAAPTTLYYAWLASEQHSAMTGAAAKIDPTVGAKYTAANGYISGKLVILDLGRRLVMSWRTSDFPREANDSRVEIHLEAVGGSTRVTLLQTEIPEGQSEKYRSLWNDSYFTPMRNFFSKFLPDPRALPPPRRTAPPDEDEERDSTPPKKGLAGKRIPPKPTAAAKLAAQVEKTEKAEKASKAEKAAKAAAAPPKAAPPPPAKPAKAAPPPKAAKPAPKPVATKKPAPKPAPKAAKPAPKAAKAKPKPAPKKPAPKPKKKKK